MLRGEQRAPAVPCPHYPGIKIQTMLCSTISLSLWLFNPKSALKLLHVKR